MANGGGLDPGWYDYPSLLFLVLAPTQLGLDEPSYGAARVAAVCRGRPRRGAAWWLGRVAVGTLAGFATAVVVAVATTHVAYSRMAVTDVLLTLGVTVCLALLVSGRLEWAGVAAGLAASAKYPGAILLVPLVVAGWGAWRRLGRAAALAVVAFALTSPFVVLHAGDAWDDFRRVQSLAQDGWLGFEDDPATPLAFALRLWEAVGPIALLAVVGAVVALARRTRDGPRARLVRRCLRRSRCSPRAPTSTATSCRSSPSARSSPRGRRHSPSRRSWPPSCRSGGRSRTRDRSPVATRASMLPRGSSGTCRVRSESRRTRRRCRSASGTSSGSSFPGPDAASTPTATSHDFARAGSGGSSSEEASQTASSTPPRTTRGRPASTARSRGCSPRSRRGTTRTDGHAPGCGSTASTLRRWNGVVGSTGSRSARPSFCRVPRSSGSRSPRAACSPRPSAARSTCGARSSASCSPASRSATTRAARSPTGGPRRTSSSARSRSAPGSSSRSRSSTNGCWSRSSPGTRARGSTRSSRR